MRLVIQFRFLEEMMDFLIQFRIKPDRVDEHRAAVREFVRHIRELHDAKIEYTSYELPDGVSFYNITTFADEEAEKELELYAFFDEYVSGVEERCEEEPTVTPLNRVASTRE